MPRVSTVLIVHSKFPLFHSTSCSRVHSGGFEYKNLGETPNIPRRRSLGYEVTCVLHDYLHLERQGY